MNRFKVALLGTCLAVGIAASTAAMAQDGPVIAVSWASFQEERWITDESAMLAVIEAAGGTYLKADAQQSNSKQLADIESLIARGPDALIVLAWDSDAVVPGIEAAIAEGIPVVGYDRLIEHPETFYLTFDNKEVGRMQAAAVLNVQPTGNYVFIKGYSADPNADFVNSGQIEVLQAAIDSGDIMIVGEAYTDNWQPENAQRNMEQILTANDNKIDAVVASNDGTAGGVVAALTSQGMEGTVPVSGQDGDHAALNRVALGTQTVSVWKDARNLGRVAAEIAIALAEGTAPDAIADAVKFSGGPKGVEVDAVFLAPVPITRDNLDDVVEAGWIERDVLCQGVESGSVGACP
ncbi:MAG: D-xylose ABC transporter substrate-binding protein [Alphaproteobacteria bacterium]